MTILKRGNCLVLNSETINKFGVHIFGKPHGDIPAEILLVNEEEITRTKQCGLDVVDSC
jgi:hypothetical protein